MKEISPQHGEIYHRIFRNNNGNALQKLIRLYLYPKNPKAVEQLYRFSGASITNEVVNAFGRLVVKYISRNNESKKQLTNYTIGEKKLSNYINYIFYSTTFNETIHAFVAVLGIVAVLPNLAELVSSPNFSFFAYAVFHAINAQIIIIQRYNRSGLLLKIIQEMDENPDKFGEKMEGFYNFFAFDLPKDWFKE